MTRIAQGPPGVAGCSWRLPSRASGTTSTPPPRASDPGFGVVIAHPERSADAALDGAAGLRRELAAGSLAQVNGMSLAGGHGGDARRAAYELLADGMVAVVGSDAHEPARPPTRARPPRDAGPWHARGHRALAYVGGLPPSARPRNARATGGAGPGQHRGLTVA